MNIRSLTISSEWLFLIVVAACGGFTVTTTTKSPSGGSVAKQNAEQPVCKIIANILICHVPALDNNINFKNYIGDIVWLHVYCDETRYLPSRLIGGLFAPLGQTLRNIYIYQCCITNISRHAFVGMERLERLMISGGSYPKTDNRWLGSSNVSNSTKLSQKKIELPSTTWYNDDLVLPHGVFSELHNLTVLGLEAMRLNNSVWHAVQHLRTLHHLYLKNNNITIIDINTISKLQNLEFLNLNENYIQVIPNGTFESLCVLRYLYLSSNRIRLIGREAFKGLSQLNTLLLSRNSILTIPKDIFKALSKLTTLDLSENYIRVVDIETFEGLSELYSLNLSANSISSVGNHTFQGLSDLGLLDLSGNNISKVNMDTFKGLGKLETLNLSVNIINIVGKDTFKGLSHLRSLGLSVNNIRTFEIDTLIGLGNLRKLYLTENCIKVITDPALSRLTSLQVLDLSGNLFEKLPKFPISLTSLNLRNNNILEVDYSLFAGLQRLTDLDLSHNKISKYIQHNSHCIMKELNLSFNELSVASLNLTNELVFADFRNNKLKSLSVTGIKDYRYARESGNIYLAGNGDPFRCICNIAILNNESTFIYDRCNNAQYHIWNFTSLNCMSVTENTHESEITEISARKFVCNATCYDSCTCYHWRYGDDNINIVDCLGAGLAAVPINISVSCTILDLSENMFPLLGPENFDGLYQLIELYLISSNITEIKKGTFEGLTNLRKLDLSNNSIRILDSGIFVGLSRLLSLDLSFNRIHVVVENTFKFLNGLTDLDLNGNELEAISSSDIESMYSIKSLKLSKNPWSCDCQFLKTFKPFTIKNAKHIKDYTDIKCFASNKTEHYLFQIDLENFCPKNSKSKAEIVLGSIVGVFILGNICCFVLFRNREFFKLWIFIKCGWKSASVETEDRNRPYDAFVSYSNADEAFVTGELMQHLEEPRQGRLGYKLCLHFRDFPVGGHIPETILGAVNDSRRVIMILSDNFLSSEWCNYEFQAAHHQLLTEWKNRIIMILLHDLNGELLDRQLKLYLSTRTYVKLGDPLLWDKIEYAMPERRSPVEANLNADNNDDQIDNIFTGDDEDTDEDVQLIN